MFSILSGIFIFILISFVFRFHVETVFDSILKDSENQTSFPLSLNLEKWRWRGEFIKIFDNEMFVVDSFAKQRAEEDDIKKLNEKETIVLIHGYPSSSADYQKAWSLLTLSGARVIAFDHIGFGFSQKPLFNFTFSILEHCDNLIELLRVLKVEKAHFVAHDMGDSVLTEFLTRFQKNLLPKELQKNDFFKSITFSNGGLFKYIYFDFYLFF